MTKKKDKARVVKAVFCSMPAKHVVMTLLDDGSIHCDAATTAYNARITAQSMDREASELRWQDFTLPGAKIAFDKMLAPKQ